MPRDTRIESSGSPLGNITAAHIWTAALLAMLAKLLLAAQTLGTNDVVFFRLYGMKIAEHGLVALYQSTPLFNHTPMTGLFSALLAGISGGDPRLFALLLRLPGIVADLVAVGALLRLRVRTGTPPGWALLLFALSPVSIMVTGFHGNMDPVLTALLTLAAVACVEERLAVSAGWLALACNVKVAPLLVTPVFFAWWLQRGRGWRFASIAGGLTLLGWAWPLIACPRAFLGNVLGYSGFWGFWGFTFWLYQSGLAAFHVVDFHHLPAAEAIVTQVLKFGIIAATLTIAWRTRRAETIFRPLAAVWLVFMVFAPGVVGQYLVWPAPFLLVAAPRAYALTTAACSAFLFIFYTALCKGLPWDFGVGDHTTNPVWMPWSNLAWGAFVGALFCWGARLAAAGNTPLGNRA